MTTIVKKTAPKKTVETAENTENIETAPNGVDAPMDAKTARQVARKAAQKVLKSWAQSPKLAELDAPANLIEALKTVYGAKRGASGGGIKRLDDKLAAYFKDLGVGAAVPELELFRLFKVGRGEMRKQVRRIIRDQAPENRVWLAFDEHAEDWTMLGEGAEPPKNWKGYLPTKEA